MRSGTEEESNLQFIKTFSGVEIRTLNFVHTNLGKPWLYGPRFVCMDIVIARTGLGSFVPVKRNLTVIAHNDIPDNCVL